MVYRNNISNLGVWWLYWEHAAVGKLVSPPNANLARLTRETLGEDFGNSPMAVTFTLAGKMTRYKVLWMVDVEYQQQKKKFAHEHKKFFKE